MGNKPLKKHKYDNEHRDYVRDTVCAVIVMAVLIISPIAITLYQNHKTAAANEAYMKQLQELLASPSDAAAGTPAGNGEGTEETSTADAEEANTDADAEEANTDAGAEDTETVQASDAEPASES